MAPLVVRDEDELRSLIVFRTSTLYEMFLSLRALQNPGLRHQEWAERVRARLPQDVLGEVEFFYSRFANGTTLMELAIDYPDHHDVEGFFRYVEGMDRPRFLFYALGRWAPAEEMARLRPTVESLVSIVRFSYPQGMPVVEARLSTNGSLELLDDPEGYKARLLRLWRQYWEVHFKEESERYHEMWRESIAEKSSVLLRQDALEFLRALADGHDLPEQIPEGYETQQIILVPSYFGTAKGVFYGYGSTTVIYDCQMTEERRDELARLGEEIVALGKALGDKTRLELLRRIARDPEMYGQKLAKVCHISQPSVSRHLRILKEAGLIEERPADNRISYEVRSAKIETLSPRLLTYLYE